MQALQESIAVSGCYRVGNLLQHGQSQLQSGRDITNWDSYYKVGQYLDQRYIKGSSIRVLE